MGPIFLVQRPYTEIEVSGEAHPQQIGHLEPGGPFIHLAEGEQHPQNEGPQDGQPDQGQTEGLGVEKVILQKKLKASWAPKSASPRERSGDGGACQTLAALTPIRANRALQTMGKTMLGGERGGLETVRA